MAIIGLIFYAILVIWFFVLLGRIASALEKTGRIQFHMATLLEKLVNKSNEEEKPLE